MQIADGGLRSRAGLARLAVALTSGALLFLSCADFDIWPLTWVAIVPTLFVVLDDRVKRPFVFGFATGLVANGGGFYWFMTFLMRFGHLPWWAAFPIYLLLCSYQAITFALFFTLLRRLRDAAPWSLVWTAPVLYVALELVVPSIFPWYLAITQAWVPPVIQVAELTGPLGVSFLLILGNVLVYELLRAWRQRALRATLLRPVNLAALALLAANLAFGFVRVRQIDARRRAAPTVKIGVVQANIGINEKFVARFAGDQLAVHQHESAELARRGAELILWPESSYPYAYPREQTRDWPLGDRRRAQAGFDAPLLFGALTYSTADRFPYNTAQLLDRDGVIRGRFDKNILMVFGEYVPYFDQLGFIKKWIPEVSNMARGTDVEAFTLALPERAGRPASIKLSPMICYEDIFPSFGRRLVPLSPNLLVNITNDAWFGRTSEPYEHLALSVFRAVELRLDLVRAVNTGVSAFVEASGRVAQTSPSMDPDQVPHPPPATLLGDVAILDVQTLYATLGEWFGGLCLALAIVLLLVVRRRLGRGLRWRLALLGAGAVLGCTLVLSALWAGPSQLGTALALLMHRPVAGDPAVLFGVGLSLAPGAAIGAFVAGALIRRRARDAAYLEIAIAVAGVLAAPAALVGKLEGEQAGLVLSLLFALGLALLGARLLGRARVTSP